MGIFAYKWARRYLVSVLLGASGVLGAVVYNAFKKSPNYEGAFGPSFVVQSSKSWSEHDLTHGIWGIV